MPDWWSLSIMVFIAACFGAAMTGAFFRPGPWYEALEKPPWRPANWVFPVVWTPLYGMIAAAGWIAWESAEGEAAVLPMAFWWTQIALNALWSPVFFGLRRPGLGMVVVLMLWASIAGTIWAFLPVSTVAAGLMAPYLLWVTIASALNFSVWRRNPDAHRLAV